LKATLLGKIKFAAVCALMLIACLSLGRSPSLDLPQPAAQGIDRAGGKEVDRPNPPVAPLLLARNDDDKPAERIDPPAPPLERPVTAAKIEPQWRSDHWDEHARLVAHPAPVRALAFAADSTRLVSAGDDGRIR